MTETNSDIVRATLELANTGEVDAALRYVAPDATLDWSLSESVDSGVYEGHAAWRSWLSGRFADLQDARFEVTDAIDVAPDTIVLSVWMTGRGRLSGIEIAALGAAVCTLRDGMITRLKLYQTPEAARVAAGL